VQLKASDSARKRVESTHGKNSLRKSSTDDAAKNSSGIFTVDCDEVFQVAEILFD
jgi:hypothetical protein